MYQVILIYDIFSGSFIDNLEWLYPKDYSGKKNNFFQMHNTILQRVK